MADIAHVERLVPNSPGVHAWALDFPSNGQAPRIGEGGLYLQGWLLEQTGVLRGDVIIRADGESADIVLPFNSQRPDVVQRMLGASPEGHPRLRCGFVAHLGTVPHDFRLGVLLDGAPRWLCRVRLSTDKQARAIDAARPLAIQGTDGWLFLDNDTNRSVDQFTGKLLLDATGIKRWQRYLDRVAELTSGVGARHTVLIAASKEQVLSEHYPHAKAALTVHEQVLKLCRTKHRVLDTAALLAARPDKHACFIKTDTHWTDRGAMLATLALLSHLGLDAAQAQSCFASDVYYVAPFAGDLGIKFSPALVQQTEFLQAPPAQDTAVFDNGLPNIGRVLVFANEAALWPHRVLIFGASSSYPMLKYLKRLFKRIVFVHSAGNVDPDVIRHEMPDFIVAQTTARFMIEPPGAGFNLREMVALKIDKLRAEGASEHRPRGSPTADQLYHSMMGVSE